MLIVCVVTDAASLCVCQLYCGCSVGGRNSRNLKCYERPSNQSRAAEASANFWQLL